jgi:hypothetical protein
MAIANATFSNYEGVFARCVYHHTSVNAAACKSSATELCRKDYYLTYISPTREYRERGREEDDVYGIYS